MAPRYPNDKGQRCTFKDLNKKDRDLLPLIAWSAPLVEQLYQLSKRTISRHMDAIGLLSQCRSYRYGDISNGDRNVAEILPQDVKKAVRHRNGKSLNIFLNNAWY